MRRTAQRGVVVVGDVNSTMACALAAAKLGVGVAHVEAGLRSFDRSMPEEVNRVVTDAIADLLFVSEPAGEANLRREGVGGTQDHYAGNVMIDTLVAQLPIADRLDIGATFGLEPASYALVTLHRPSNVDDTRRACPH
jgi:UDP-N-acetylglucosamine 2-epimerase (non-hydrolysing)